MPEPESVAVFWDYENCALPSNITGNVVVNNIRQLAHKYGSVKSFKAYTELPEQPSPKNIALRSDLQLCGVSVIDCPHNGGKDVADKMMIVDMMAFAIDTPAPATIILISGDRDFVYAVSILCLRQYRLVVLAPHAAHATLKTQATAVYAWPGDLLPDTKSTTNRRASTSSNTFSDSIRSPGEAIPRPVSQAAPSVPTPASPPPSPAALRKPIDEQSAAPRDGTPFVTPSWMSSDTLFAVSSGSDSQTAVNTPSSTSTAVDADASLTETFSAPPESPPRKSWADIAFSPPPPDAPAAVASSWVKYLNDLSDLRLNAEAPPFRSALESTLPPAESNITAPPTPQPSSKAIPSHFKPLVKVLKKSRAMGIPKVDFSGLGTLLRQESAAVYERAGVTKLKEYTTLAQEAKIVVIEDNIHGPGGIDGQRWVSLHPRLLKPAQAKVQSSLNVWL